MLVTYLASLESATTWLKSSQYYSAWNISQLYKLPEFPFSPHFLKPFFQAPFSNFPYLVNMLQF